MSRRCRPEAAGGALAATEPQTTLPALDHVHSQGSGLPQAVGTICLPPSGGALSSQGSVCPPAAPPSWPRGVGLPPPPLPATKGSLAGRHRCSPSPLGCPMPLAQGRDSSWGPTAEAGARDMVTWREPLFFVPQPSSSSLDTERGWWLPPAASGTDRDPSQQRQANPCYTLSPCRRRAEHGLARPCLCLLGRKKRRRWGRAGLCRAARRDPPLQRWCSRARLRHPGCSGGE